MTEPGVIVVTCNSARHVRSCLEAAAPRAAGVVVVDNASSDGTVEAARAFGRGVHVAANAANRGFAAAVNQGVRMLGQDFLLLLNPDARILTPLDPMLDLCRRDGVGAVGGRLVSPGSGADQAGFTVRRFPTPASLIFECLGVNRLWPDNPVNRRYRAADLDLRRRQRVEQPAGAFLMFRRQVWERLGGFDERFHPLWFEDVDFLQRAARAGYEIWYEPDAVAEHDGGHSLAALQPSQRQQYWYGNLLQYAARHFHSGIAFRAVAAAVLAGSLGRRLVRPAGGTGIGWLALRCMMMGGGSVADGVHSRARLAGSQVDEDEVKKTN